ncbi:MAG: cupin domain-containing protein [Chloroflexi bacterium]|nr:cupin domain-containing protein [Chloroflexota bacterium]
MERQLETRRESEPRELVQESNWAYQDRRRRQMMEGEVVVRGKDMPWEQNRQGYIKYLCHTRNWDTLGVPLWSVFVHRIKNHSGKHTHQGGLGLFVLEGRGYTVVDGVRYDWEKNDLILLPVKPGGCEHQHFNMDADRPAEWLAFIFTVFRDATGNLRNQQEMSPDWHGPTLPPHMA